MEMFFKFEYLVLKVYWRVLIMKRKVILSTMLFVVIILVGLSLNLTVFAEQPFYEGKSIELVASFPPGGMVDLQARIMAAGFEKHIPGNPRVQVRNMPGGGALLSANWFEKVPKHDGLTMYIGGGSPLIAYVIGQPEVEYNILEWRLVSTNAGGSIFVVSPETGIEKPEDLLNPRKPLVFGELTATGTALGSILALEALDLDVKIVLGFEGKGQTLQAFERGETTIEAQTTAAAYLNNLLPLVEEGKAIPIMSKGTINQKGEFERDPTDPEIPSVYEVYNLLYGEKPDDLLVWQAFRAVMGAGYAFRGCIWMPKNTPSEAMDALYIAIENMNNDPEFLEKAKILYEYFPLVPGNLAENTVREILNVKPEVQSYLRNLLSTKYKVKF